MAIFFVKADARDGADFAAALEEVDVAVGGKKHGAPVVGGGIDINSAFGEAAVEQQ